MPEEKEEERSFRRRAKQFIIEDGQLYYRRNRNALDFYDEDGRAKASLSGLCTQLTMLMAFLYINATIIKRNQKTEMPL